VRLVSRNGYDLIGWFPTLSALAKAVRADALLDGEIIAGDGTMTSFKTLRSREAVHSFVAFDVLAADGHSLIDQPLEERGEVLRDIVVEGERIAISRGFSAASAEPPPAKARRTR
jgi:bifunctional non-homologous end joining protein LigD